MLGYGFGVAGLFLHFFFRVFPLFFRRLMGFLFCVVPYAVEQEESARLYILYHIILVNISGIVTRYEIGLIHIVTGLDRFIAKTQVGYGYTARFL